MKCTDKTNKDAETAMLEALRPPLDTNIAGTCGELYAVWASKAMVDKFVIKIREALKEALSLKITENVEVGVW